MDERLIDEPNESVFEVSGMFKNSFNKLYEYLEKGTLCDVVICAGKKSFKCHRLVLACCSPYFHAMFTSSLAESKKTEITIGDIDEITMEMLLKFAYTAKVALTPSNAQALLQASSILQLDSLAQACCDFICTQLHSSNCIGIHDLALRLGQVDLATKSDLYIKLNFRQVVLEEEFVTLTFKHLKDIISSDDLFVNCEVEVYEAVMLWVKHDVDKRREYLPKLLLKVHLPLIPTAFLRMYVESDSLIRKSFECRDLLDEARHYQMWHNIRLPTTHLPINERTKQRKSYAAVIFCVGGRGMNGTPFSSIEVYSLFYNKWMKLNAMSYCRRHVGCISSNGKIYAVGGCDNQTHLASAEVFDPVTNKWSDLASMSTPRRGLGLCAMGGPIYAVGGLDDTLFFSVVERYDVNADVWSSVAPMNCARGGVAVTKLKGLMYAIGGNSGSVSLNTCEIYDPHLNKWHFISSMNQARAGAAAVVQNGFIYIIGGFENNAPLNTIERYDPDTNQWTFVSPMKIGRGGVGAAATGGFIFAIGGHNATHYLNSVEVYDVQQDRWTIGPEISDYRAGAGVTACTITADNLLKLFKKPPKENLI